MSWGQIAEALNIPRSSAIRVYRKPYGPRGTEIASQEPQDALPTEDLFQNRARSVPEFGSTPVYPRVESRKDDPLPEAARLMPKSLQLFQALLKKAAEEGQKSA